MKNSFKKYSFNYNPSLLGADNVWNFSKIRGINFSS